MGVDIQTYRAKIGTYRHSCGLDVVTAVLVVNFSHGVKTIGCVLFISLLLIMAGVEQNPGPKESDDRQATELGKTTSIKVTELAENITRENLKLSFQEQGFGDVNEVTVNNRDKSAIIEFVDTNAANFVLQHLPIRILGTNVNVERFDNRIGPDETEGDKDSLQSDEAVSIAEAGNNQPTKLRVTGLPKGTTNYYLSMFFENENRQGGGKVREVIAGDKGDSAIVDFEEASAIEKVMLKRPIIIQGKEVNVEVFVVKPSTEEIRPTKIEVSGIPEVVTDETLVMFFENKHRQGGGPVKSVTIDCNTHTAVVEFEEAEAVDIVVQNRPIVIHDTEVKIQVLSHEQAKANTETKTIKVSGLPRTATEEFLLMFFENENRQGGGKVFEVFLNKLDGTALVTFEEEKAVNIVLEKQPIKILGCEIRVEEYSVQKKPVPRKSDTVFFTLTIAVAVFAVILFFVYPQLRHFFISDLFMKLTGGIMMIYQLYRRRKTKKKNEHWEKPSTVGISNDDPQTQSNVVTSKQEQGTSVDEESKIEELDRQSNTAVRDYVAIML